MGQYYFGCVLKKNFKTNDMGAVIASIYPHHYMIGLKMCEHSYVGNIYLKSVIQMIALNNGNPFVWCGDYADEIFTNNRGEMFNAYQIAKHLSPLELHELAMENGIEDDYKYIVNHTKREYVKVPEQKEGALVIHPLPLLCADGHGRGGGDFNEEEITNYDLIGSWAYDRISVTNKRPHYKRLKVEFNKN